ncbi:MAG: hypothetical protein ACREI3_03300, partial [Nitrospirales bacterium]
LDHSHEWWSAKPGFLGQRPNERLRGLLDRSCRDCPGDTACEATWARPSRTRNGSVMRSVAAV